MQKDNTEASHRQKVEWNDSTYTNCELKWKDKGEYRIQRWWQSEGNAIELLSKGVSFLTWASSDHNNGMAHY